MDPTVAFMKVPSFGTLEEADCGLCGAPDWHLVTRQRMFGEDFQVVRCGGCGLIRTNPRPDAEWKERFYDPKYNGYLDSQARDFVYAPQPTRATGYRRLTKLLRERAAPNSKLLDVGCAAGMFVRQAIDDGFDACGCDYSDAAIAYGRDHYGVRIIRSVAENIDEPDNKYDVVTLLHVFEHLPDPMGVLRELRRVLKPGGLLLLETVNYRAHYAMEKHLKFLIPVYGHLTKRGGLPWVPFDHLYHWSPETLKRAMASAGFNGVELQHLTGYRSEMKPNQLFSFVYSACELVDRALMTASGGRWHYWPVLLATGTK